MCRRNGIGVNSLAPGRTECDFKNVIFNLALLIRMFKSFPDNVLRCMPQDLTDDKSILVQVMTWCRQATSHYLSQCWPRSMSPNDVTRPQWVNVLQDISTILSVKWFVTGSGDGLVPIWHRNPHRLPIGTIGTHLSEIWMKIHTCSFNRMHFVIKISFGYQRVKSFLVLCNYDNFPSLMTWMTLQHDWSSGIIKTVMKPSEGLLTE